jgi:tetrahydromethanopterin S-methyltransferase subunit D
MKQAILALALLSASSLTAAQAAAKFEAVVLPSGAKASNALFRIEVATGTVVSLWGVGATQFVPSTTAAPLPAGEYHLYKSENATPDGTVYWSLYRMEVNTGRVWNLTGGGDQPYTWIEPTSTAAPVMPPAAK